MNQKEVNEIRRRFKLDKNAITRIYGCYVNSAGEPVTYIDSSMAIMPQSEQETYLSILKKTLSGTLGKNLLDIEFSVKQVMNNEEHKLLQALRTSSLKDDDARNALYQKIIAALDMDGGNYLILLGADSYDVPHRGKDDEMQADASDQVFSYFVCCICPVKDATLALRYFADEKEFHTNSVGQTVASPELGFMFPAFDDRSANIYNALMYNKDPGRIHEEFISAVFGTDAPMSADEQKDAFESSLSDTLESQCSFEVVQAVHEQITERITRHKESKDPEPPDLSLRELGDILKGSGVDEGKVEAFQSQCERRFGDSYLNPNNIIESKKFEVTTPEVKISVSPENSYLLETRVINGRKYILIPADEQVEINGLPVTIS